MTPQTIDPFTASDSIGRNIGNQFKYVPAGTVSNPSQALAFYGASRFEAPRIGLKFRRCGTTFQILGIRAERTRSPDFARSWKFTTECQILPHSDY